MKLSKDEKLILLNKFLEQVKAQMVLNEIDLRYFNRAILTASQDQQLQINAQISQLKPLEGQYEIKLKVIEDIIKETEKTK